MNFQQFKDKWKEFDSCGLGYLKLSLDHPLDFHVGYSTTTRKALVVMNTGKIENIPCSNAISAKNRELKDGSWSLEFQLIQDEFED